MEQACMATSITPRISDTVTPDFLSGANHLAFIPYADALRAQGRLGVALKICQQGLSRWPTSLAGRVLLARIHFDMGKHELAEAECTRVLAHAPDSVSVRKLLVQMALRRRRFAQALGLLEDLRASLGEDPDLISAFLEAQRGLAERFSHELQLAGAFTSHEVSAGTRGELLVQMRERPEVRAAELVGPADRVTPWGDMLRAWETICQRAEVSIVRHALLETSARTVLAREMPNGGGTLVVELEPRAGFGPIKHLAEKFASLPADEDLNDGVTDPDSVSDAG
jgi:tetratricopeptide (TPR) repeat protein